MSFTACRTRTLCAGIILASVAGLAPPAFGQVLASYEPAEGAGLTVTAGPTDPGLTVTWPVRGGRDGVPPATEGMHVLKMEWTGEMDRKVEVRHDWTDFTFDLLGYWGGVAEIQADVYIASASALPQIVGIWDDVFDWTGGCPVPLVTDQWVTVSMNVGHLYSLGLNHIVALLFEGLAGDAGVIYVDNLRLVSTRQIRFAGHDWIVKSGDYLGPGPNCFSQSEQNVWVDAAGRLHLKIAQRCGRWFCSEVIARDSLGYGTYAFALDSRVDSLDPNAVLGLFTWDDVAPEYHYREIDVEFSRWGDPENDNGQYVVQPWDTPGNMFRFNVDYAGHVETTTHRMTWGVDAIGFESYYGGFCSIPPPADTIATWSYGGLDNPPPGGENVHANLWLMNGAAPANGQDIEVVISDFRYATDAPADTDNDGVCDACDLCPNTPPGGQVRETGCAPGDADHDGDVDLIDFGHFQGCFNGPNRPPAGSGCEDANFDNDAERDVDLVDFSVFRACFNGPNRPPAC